MVEETRWYRAEKRIETTRVILLRDIEQASFNSVSRWINRTIASHIFRAPATHNALTSAVGLLNHIFYEYPIRVLGERIRFEQLVVYVLK